MKKIVLLLLLCLAVGATQAQIFKKAGDKIRSVVHKKGEETDSSDEDGGDMPMAPSDRANAAANPSLQISGDSSVLIDSTFDFDVAVYQEMEAYQGNQLVIDGGQEIVIYYSSNTPQFSIQLSSRSTGTRNHFYGDFAKESLLSLSSYEHIGSGEKKPMELQELEPVYPGDFGYLSQLLKTGNKKVIAGVACEEYVAQNQRQDARITNTNRGKVKAHVWIPMDPRTLFPGYAFIPQNYQDQIETIRTQGGYAPVIFPLEMYLEYGNGDKIYTYTNDIIMGEHRTVKIEDINK